MIMHDEAKKFRLWVDNLEAALNFDDFPGCLNRLRAEQGKHRTRVAVYLLAARLLERRAT